GREPQVGLGALTGAESTREHAHRALIDLYGTDLERGVAPSRLIGDARGRSVANVSVLGAHDRGHDLANAGAALPRDALDRRITALDPAAPDEANAREREVHLRLRPGDTGRRRDDGDAQRLDLAQVRRTDLQRVGAERNAIQAPACRSARGIGQHA